MHFSIYLDADTQLNFLFNEKHARRRFMELMERERFVMLVAEVGTCFVVECPSLFETPISMNEPEFNRFLKSL